jgi:hypothetical protein
MYPRRDQPLSGEHFGFSADRELKGDEQRNHLLRTNVIISCLLEVMGRTLGMTWTDNDANISLDSIKYANHDSSPVMFPPQFFTVRFEKPLEALRDSVILLVFCSAGKVLGINLRAHFLTPISPARML